MKQMTFGILLVLGALSLGFGPSQAADKPDDADALQGVTQGRVVFDINISEPKTLPLYLMVIDESISDLERQGVKPVGNTFVSLVGYQAQGYATIPIY